MVSTLPVFCFPQISLNLYGLLRRFQVCYTPVLLSLLLTFVIILIRNLMFQQADWLPTFKNQSKSSKTILVGIFNKNVCAIKQPDRNCTKLYFHRLFLPENYCIFENFYCLCYKIILLELMYFPKELQIFFLSNKSLVSRAM